MKLLKSFSWRSLRIHVLRGIGRYIILGRYVILGRKKHIQYLFSQYIGVKWNAKDVAEEEWEQLYQSICERYVEIRMHLLAQSDRIGEYIPRYLIAVEDAKRNAENGILDVFVLSDYINHNSRLTTIMGRNISIIDRGNVDEWGYILIHFPKVVSFKYFWDYQFRNHERLLKSENTAQYLMLTPEEEEEARNKKEQMGLDTPFVCTSSRDAAYLATTHPDIDYGYHDYRDSDINNIALAANYFADKQIMTVRMGRHVRDKATFGNCIDYANKYYDELMDIALMKDCKFFVGDSNGLCIFPMVFNTPYALKNVVPVFGNGFGAHPQSVQGMYIFKKYYSKIKNRFLSMKEMIETDKIVISCGQGINRKYAELGIEIIENSAEEILDLVMEMNARIDGEWVETEGDIERQEKYHRIFEQWRIQENYRESEVLCAKVGALFLRKNSFLLD